MEKMMSVDAVIPTFRPDDKFYRLLDGLKEQSVAIAKVWVVNTYADAFSNLSDTLAERYGDWVSVTDISEDEFDHGKARNLGASFSSADYLLFMTQDAVPADVNLVESLLLAFEDRQVAVAYARQLPTLDADDLEQLMRAFNYPELSKTKTIDDLKLLGIKTYFCSNVCALYSRQRFVDLATFPEGMIFNEDMLFASKAIQQGYAVRYEAKAQVVHSHNYGLIKSFRRYFDMGVSQRQNRAVFSDLPAAQEGRRLVSYVSQHLAQQKRWLSMGYFFLQSVMKYLGLLCGKHYNLLPVSWCRKLSSFPAYWNRPQHC